MSLKSVDSSNHRQLTVYALDSVTTRQCLCQPVKDGECIQMH